MKKDVWAAGNLYEPYVGRWSRVVASEFLPWLGVPAGSVWLDVGCGTGALTQCILRDAAPENVHGIDPSPGFIEYARAHTGDRRASFEVGDAQALPVASARFDAAVAGLVLNRWRRKNAPRCVSASARSSRSARTVRSISSRAPGR